MAVCLAITVWGCGNDLGQGKANTGRRGGGTRGDERKVTLPDTPTPSPPPPPETPAEALKKVLTDGCIDGCSNDALKGALRAVRQGTGGVNDKVADADGGTVLHLLVQDAGADEGLLPALLKAGAAADARNNCGEAPLHLAARQGSKSCIEQLLNHGADPNMRDNGGDAPLHKAVSVGHKKASIDGLDRLEALLADPRIDINIQNNKGESPLHSAVDYGGFGTVFPSILLKKGADPNLGDKDGNTPLHWAAAGTEQAFGCLAELQKRGGDINALNERGETPLYHMIDTNQVSGAVLNRILDLIEAGADPSVGKLSYLDLFEGKYSGLELKGEWKEQYDEIVEKLGGEKKDS